uniref:Exosome complex component RRP4 n=1 Tax=Phallusia mammillata TaxID=59560 RepID=A0A6F9DCF7_9ASCI|nr:exosome complex component RRP4 [Phallusia mammillata]
MSSSTIVIKAPSKRRNNPIYAHASEVFLVTPGDVITEDADYMRGHGTYTNAGDEDNKLYASVAGVVERINKLVCVKALKTRYNGEVGDVVVGRIKEVQQKRWKVETNSRLDSTLQISSVNLPGGELRRRSAADELTMREYLKEGDLISAEVQQVHNDGMLSLHTRSLRYGKLGQGCCVVVSPSLIKRRKNHIHNLPCGATTILANNGYIWISITSGDACNEGDGGFNVNKEPVPLEEREVVCRLKNCIQCLAKSSVMLYDTSVLYAYESSLQYQVKEIMSEKVSLEIVNQTISLLEREKTGDG